MEGQDQHNTGKRLKQYLEHLNLEDGAAAEKLDMRPAQLTRIIQGKNFRVHWLLRIQEAFPNLNTHWLLTGRGEMLKSDEIVPTRREMEAVRLLDEAVNLRARIAELPAKRKAELCGQVIDTAKRVMEDNNNRRTRLVEVRRQFMGMLLAVKERRDENIPLPSNIENLIEGANLENS